MKYLQIIFVFIFLKNLAWGAPPSSSLNIEIKTACQTFNHVQDFALQDGRLWYRLRYDLTSFWKEIPLNRTGDFAFREIKADGANLMLRDSMDRIHYKKVLKEWHNRKGLYRSQDIALESSWIPFWFSVPVVRLPQFLPFKDFHLKLPKGAKSWAMSHRGSFNFYFEDIRGRQHSAFHMVTTVYAIPANGKDILYADPFLIGGFRRTIKGPHPDFIADQIAASASMLFIVGSLDGRSRYYTRLADFDTMGKNPMLPGFWSNNSAAMNAWEEVQVPLLEGRAMLSKNITIFQTGLGNSARELRIEGENQSGLHGFYRKSIDEEKWEFIPLEILES